MASSGSLTDMLSFLSGMIFFGQLVAALFFVRFWKRTGDMLFAAFGLSFVLFAVSQAASFLSDAPREDRAWIYLFRLTASPCCSAPSSGKIWTPGAGAWIERPGPSPLPHRLIV